MSYEAYKYTMNETQYANLLLKKLKEYPEISGEETIAFFSGVFAHRFKPYLISVFPTSNVVFKMKPDDYKDPYQRLLDLLFSTDLSIVEAFARAKYYLDRIFFQMTDEGCLDYTYNPNVLLTAEELKSELGVSQETLHRYTERGLEIVEGHGQKKYPLHNVFYWNNALWVARLQILNQAFRVRNRTEEDIKKEIEARIIEFEALYGGTFAELDKTISDPYSLENPTDFYEWRHLTKELEELTQS